MRPSAAPAPADAHEAPPDWADTEIDDSRERHALALAQDGALAPEAVALAAPVAPDRTARPAPADLFRPPPQLPWREGLHLLLAGLTGMAVAWLGSSVLGYRLLGAGLGFLAGLLVLWGLPLLRMALHARGAGHSRRRVAKKKPGRSG